MLRLGHIQMNRTAFFLCDVQERFRPHIRAFPTVVQVAKTMVSCPRTFTLIYQSEAAKELKLPLIITEQYPEGLGTQLVNQAHRNRQDSVWVGPYLWQFVSQEVFFYGIWPNYEGYWRFQLHRVVWNWGRSCLLRDCWLWKAHVCVLQTALDLLAKGKEVHLVMDGTSSMRQFDRMAAFARMREAGVYLTTCESILFQLVRGADHPNFKAVSNLMKQHNSLKMDPEIPFSSLW